MENIAPPLRLLMTVRAGLENGESTLTCVRRYLQSYSDDFTPCVAKWLFEIEQGLAPSFVKLTQQRRVLLEVLRSGLKGQAIYQRLVELEEDFVACCEDQIKSELDSAPLKLMIPLLLFQFPAYLLLLFGPIMQKFLESLGP